MTTLRLAIAVAVLALILVVAGPAACRYVATLKQQAKVERGQASAAASAGQEALNTQSNAAERAAQVDERVSNGQGEIYARPGGDSNDAAVRAACRMPVYASLERCARLRTADSAGNAKTDTGR
ncbi:hypothetical protein [Sphingobium yanoikuyae]|uniref:hypothetical protein n=1 Tax=Sphingobium yanoikuyae TaxID=13690 RepID=UPI0035C69A52